MKALTLTQPWATLVALGEKAIETRSWYTPFRGEIAIHAAMGFPGWAKRLCFEEPFSIVLSKHGLSPDNLPLGRILCTVSLEDCIETRSLNPDYPSEQERAFGDFSYGRFAWLLAGPLQTFDPAPYVKGHLGLWNWEERA